MPSRLTPYISFNGAARKAMEFYEQVYGGTASTSTFCDSGASDPAVRELIMHAMLETPSGFTLMASDTPPGMEYAPGTNISISLSGDDAEGLRGYWEKLADRGTVTVPLEKQMWGDEFGACRDRFGISWMVNIGSPQP